MGHSLDGIGITDGITQYRRATIEQAAYISRNSCISAGLKGTGTGSESVYMVKRRSLHTIGCSPRAIGTTHGVAHRASAVLVQAARISRNRVVGTGLVRVYDRSGTP
jgi:hypothetical protein